MKQLAGVMFVRNGELYDYCYMEAIDSMLKICDAVFVVDAGSTDGTLQNLRAIDDKRFILIEALEADWHKIRGREKLSHFVNVAIAAANYAGYEYCLYCQADEVIHENSKQSIRHACLMGQEAYLVSRINLWSSPYFQLEVEQSRLPCRTEVVRLAKSNYKAYDDAESLDAELIANGVVSVLFYTYIRIYHMGFVRDRQKMIAKAIEMQENIFELGHHDPKLDTDKFKPELWFDKNDLRLIREPLPGSIQEWAEKRVYKLN